MITPMHEIKKSRLLDRVAEDSHLDFPFLLSAAVEAARQEKAMKTDLYKQIMDLNLNPLKKFLLVKKSLMDRKVSLVGGVNEVHRNAKFNIFMQAFIAHLLGAEHAVLPNRDKLCHPVFSLMAPLAPSGPSRRHVNYLDDAGLRHVRALPDWTMLGCIQSGSTVTPQHDINLLDSSCILQRIEEKNKAALRSDLYLFPRRNTTVEFPEFLQPLLYEHDLETPILPNIIDGVIPFVPGSRNMHVAMRAIAALYTAIDKAKANGLGHTINFETGDILILKKQAVLYSKEYLDYSTPVLMGGTDRELVRSYWLSNNTFAKMKDCGLFYGG
jgi:hypothetical protein